jgi:hypothetical protein
MQGQGVDARGRVKKVVKQRKGGKKGSRKYGRNRVKCEQYRRLGRRERNKARRIHKDQKRASWPSSAILGQQAP